MFDEWTDHTSLWKYQPCGKWSEGRTLKRLLDCQCDRKRLRGLKFCKLCDDNFGGVLPPPSGSTIVLLLNCHTLEVMAVHSSGTSVDIHQSTKNWEWWDGDTFSTDFKYVVSSPWPSTRYCNVVITPMRILNCAGLHPVVPHLLPSKCSPVSPFHTTRTITQTNWNRNSWGNSTIVVQAIEFHHM